MRLGFVPCQDAAVTVGLPSPHGAIGREKQGSAMAKKAGMARGYPPKTGEEASAMAEGRAGISQRRSSPDRLAHINLLQKMRVLGGRHDT